MKIFRRRRSDTTVWPTADEILYLDAAERSKEDTLAPTLEVVVDSPTIPAHGSTGFHAVLSGVAEPMDVELTITTSTGLSGSGTIHVEGDLQGFFGASATVGTATIDAETGVGTFQAP